MDCEFCAAALPTNEPENIALLDHVRHNAPCEEQYSYMLDNLRDSWTVNMSGG